MKTGNLQPNKAITKQRLALSIFVLIAASAFSADQTDEKVAGIIGIIKGQTARLNIVNIGDSNGIPPGPCKGTLTYESAEGNLLGISKDVSLEVGQADFLDLNADTLTFTGRQSLVGTVDFPPSDPDPSSNTIVTLELFNNRNLRTEAFAPEPHLAEPAEQEHNGMVGVARGQTVRLNVVNLADGSVTPDPCQMSMSLLDSRGGVLLGPIDVTLDFGE